MEKIVPAKTSSFASREDNKKEDAHAQVTDADGKLDGPEVIDAEDQQREKVDDSSSDLDSTGLLILSEEIDRFLAILPAAEPKSEPPEIPCSVDKFAKLVEEKITQYDSQETPAKWCQVFEEDSPLLEAVDRISKITKALAEFPSENESFNRTSSVLQRAMSFLEEEFRSLLEDSTSSDSDPSDSRPNNKQPSSAGSNHDADRCALWETESSGDVNFPGYPPDVVSKLNAIAKAMISAGYETECCQVYSIARRSAFEERLSKLGFEKISIDDVQRMQWESLEGEISTWIKAFKRCVNSYFPGERKFCESVFSDHPSVSGSLFSNLTRGVVIQLLNFAEAVAMTKRSGEKLFKFLDMYETLCVLIPSMDGLFSDECTQELKSETSSARCRLGVAVVSIFCDLENSIKSDTGKTPVPGGAVHPLTRYIMNYLKYACEYKDTLEQVFQEHQKVEQSDASTGSDAESEMAGYNNGNNNGINNEVAKPSPFSTQLLTIMDLLDSYLEAKSKLYKDLSLSYIFLMNNGRYILQKIKGSAEIHELMGDTWCRKRSSDLRQYHKNYQRETWSKVLGCFKDEGLQVNGKVAKPVLKERFKSFNAMFDEIHRTQSSWVVSDEQLQSELRVSISAVVIPAYRSFLGRFRQYLDAGRQSEKYIKYQSEDIETSIDELFDGNPTSMARRRT